MKGCLLAGGTGSRLWPLTKVTNKHLLPVYNKPMIYHPIQTLIDSGIDDILIVTNSGDMVRVLENGEQFGLKQIHYRFQKDASGIADALSLAKDWANNEPIFVVLGDNIFENNMKNYIDKFKENPIGARIFTYEVENPKQYGVVETNDKGEVVSIEEKPKNPKSNKIAVGAYIYDSQVWNFVDKLKPSERGELEITDVNNFYLKSKNLNAYPIQGGWADCGESIDIYLNSNFLAKKYLQN